MIKITVEGHDGDRAWFEIASDADLGEFAHLFRSILFWLTFHIRTIDDYIPDRDREWTYQDAQDENVDDNSL
jgi:hypothetical protein